MNKNNYDPDELLIWIDLETTGFGSDFNGSGYQLHKILEIGLHITDSNLNIIDSGIQIPIHYEYDEIRPLMDDIVFEMHTKNGLLFDVESSSYTIESAQNEILNYVSSYNIKRKKSPICGNNVSFDREFIDAQMLKISDFLHYRKLDVSSFKELFSRLYKNDYEAPKKGMNHRALADIKESILELKSYVNKFMIPLNNVIDNSNQPEKNNLKKPKI